MELKFAIAASAIKTLVCSNRTFMELKYLTRKHMSMGKVVLIVPLWN